MTEPLHILHLEDSPSDAKLVAIALRRAGRPIELEVVETADAMRAALARRSWDLVISDWTMPTFSAGAALEVVHELQLDLPFIIVTGTMGEEHAVAAMRAGAHDYMLKSQLARLAPAIERALREHELRKAHRLAEERKLAVAAASLDAIVGMDRHGRITDLNAAAERAFGYAREEALGRPLAELIIPERLRQAHARGLARYLASGEHKVLGTRVEMSALRRDGTEFPVEISISRVGIDGEPSFIGFVRDISERHAAARALDERMRAAELGAEVGIALASALGFTETLQRCCDATVKRLDAGLVRVWTLDASRAVLELQASAGPSAPTSAEQERIALGAGEIGLIAEQRRTRIVTDLQGEAGLAPGHAWARAQGLRGFAAHPLVVGDELLGMLAVYSRETFADVALAALGSIADAIAVRARSTQIEHANALLEEQLRHAQKMEAVGRLAGGVAHDFNNVLSVILSYSELLLDDLKLGDPVRADILEIREAGERAANLTRQLLMFSRQQMVEPRVLQLNDLLETMQGMLERVVGDAVQMVMSPGAALPCVRIDPTAMEQVIMNLVVNARDAMPAGGRLTLETSRVLLDAAYASAHLGVKAGAYTVLSVTDSGTGMDKPTLARIFEPFFTTKEAAKGTGLGLATAFGVVQQGGGAIWVYSELGLGTTFKVYLPSVDDRPEIAPGRAAAAIARGTETILLVEDQTQVRDVARGILRRYGYTVVEARSGEDALLVCERHAGPIDLLLSDIVMPGMSGPEVARGILQRRPSMKVLCMSGYADDAALRHGVVDASFAYLQKPLTVESLTRKVREVLDA